MQEREAHPHALGQQAGRNMSYLVIQSGKQKGKRLTLPEGKEILVGRDEASQIRLASSLVSRKHCTLRATPEGIWVSDLGSQNGTFVNDVAITQPTLLAPGDLLKIGAMVFQVPGQKAAAASGVSENVIADWLSDDEIPTPEESSDTTVIAPSGAAAPGPESASTAEFPNVVVQEAAEVIRRYWADLRSREASGQEG